jgi:TonB family protein
LLLAGASSLPGEAALSPEVVRLNGKSASKLIVHFVKPEYPPVAKVNYIQGRVKIEIEVNREGAVTKAHVIDGEPLLAAAALEAVREWRYRPFVNSSGPTPFQTYVSVNFNMHIRKVADLPGNPEDYLQKQVHPPEVVTGPGNEFPSRTVLLRVLVGPKGQVLDSIPLGDTNGYLQEARQKVRSWKFRAARWGALAIPWYLVVKVPIEHALIPGDASNSNTP